jgi:hypothetical protein
MPLSADLKRQILECLNRSGYLLESRLVRRLSEDQFFVEPNIAVVDPRTGKTRELDLVAEYFDPVNAQPDVSVTTHFAIEAINNPLPLVLMTEHPWSPNENPEDYLRYGTMPIPSLTNAFDLYSERVGTETIKYSQYCALSRKREKDELMASHPDDLYSSLLKLSEFVEYGVTEFDNREWFDGHLFWRLWFWEPVLVLGGDLLVAKETSDGTIDVEEVDYAALIFNFHIAEEPKTVVIRVLRERHLLPFLKSVIAVDNSLEARIHEMRFSGVQSK